MAIKISGSTIIDDSRVIVNADKIGIGQTTPRYDLEIFSTGDPTGIAVSVTSTQETDTNKAISIFNNSSTLAFSASYRGRVDAQEYHGVFKGTIDTGVSISKADTIDITDDTSGSGTHYIHFGSATDGYDGVEVDSTGLVYKDGKVGINSTAPTAKLDVTDGTTRISFNRTNNNPHIDFKGNNAADICQIKAAESSGGGVLQLFTKNTSGNSKQRFTIDADGRVLIGNITNRTTRTGTSGYSGSLQIESDSEAAFVMTRFGDAHPSRLNLQHARGTIASIAAAQDDDDIGQISFSAWDGDTFTNAAEIRAEVDGVPGDDDMPGRLIFSTTPDDANGVQERLRIESGGTLFSKSPSDATPNFKFISDDTNWHGYLNQTVHGATISTILSCGGTWTVDGTTYNATKDYNGSFGTAALIVHNQYNSTVTGGELVFVTKANGSSTTDGAVSERFRITSGGDVGIGTNNPTGANALTNNTATLAVGIVTANTIYANIEGTITPTGSLTIQDNLTVNGNTTLGDASGDTLTVNATSTFNGKVGIGTDNPTTGKLEIADAAQTNLLVLKRTSGNSGELSVQLGGSDPGVLLTTSGISDDFVFRPGGTEKLRINSTGDLILSGGKIYGEDNASNSLHLQSTSGNNNHSRIEIGTNEGSDNGGIHFYTAGASVATRRITIKGTSGNVGIGTDNPTTNLQVNDASNESTISLYNAGTKKMALQASNSFGSILYSYDDEPLIFSVHSASSFSEKLRISSGIGSVSIGSAAEGQRQLDVVGNSILVRPVTNTGEHSSGNANAVNNSIIVRMPFGENAASTTNAGARFGIQFTGANDPNNATFGLIDDPQKSAAIYGVSEDNLGYSRKVGLAFYTSAFDAVQTERLRITSDGDVGIGTFNPTGVNAVTSANTATLAVGILTARQIFGPVTGSLNTDGNVDIGGNLDVDGTTDLDILNVSETATFTTNINANGNIVGDNSTAITGISRISGSGAATMAVQNVQYVGRSNDPYAGSFLHLNDQNVPPFGSGGNFTTLASISGLNLIYDSNNNDNNGFVVGVGSTNVSDVNTFTAHMVIDHTGAVGFGTNTPGHSLHLQKDNPTLALESNTTTGNTNIVFGDSASSTQGRIQYHNNGDYMRFYTNGDNERLRITSDGKVGIGTVIPQGALDVWGDGSEYPTLRLGTEAYNTEGEDIRFGRLDHPQSDIRYHSIYSYHHATDSSNYLKFSVHKGSVGGNNTLQTDVMYLIGDGDVGIGTDNPTGANALTNNTTTLAVGTLKAATIDGQITGTITNAVTTANLTLTDHTTDTECFLVFAQAATNAQLPHTNTNLKFNSNTGDLILGGKAVIAHANTLHSGNLQVSTSGSDAIDINAYSSTADNGGRLTFYRSKNASIGSNTIVVDDDSLGRIDFRGYNNNGNSYNQGATIEARVDGSVNSSTDMPTAILFKTSEDGSSSPSERLRITSAGKVGIGTNPAYAKLEIAVGNETNSDTEYYGQDFAIAVRANRGENAGDEGNGIVFAQRYFSGDPAIVRTGAILGYKQSGTGNFGGGLIFKTQEHGASPMSEKLRITSDGKVGIGTVNPQTILHLHDSTNTRIQFTDNGTNAASGDGVIAGLNGDDDFFINNRESGKGIKLFTGSDDLRLHINSVGITSVQGQDDQDNFIVDVSGTEFAVHTDATDGEVSLRAQDKVGSTNAKYMTFFTQASGQSAAEKLRITSTGDLLRGGTGQDIGASDARWDVGYFNTINATNITGTLGSPGSDTQVLFNDGGTNVGADAGLTYIKGSDKLVVAGQVNTPTLFLDETANSVEKITGADGHLDLYADSSIRLYESDGNRLGITFDVNRTATDRDVRMHFIGENTTYLHSPAVNTLAFTVSGTETLRLQSSSLNLKTDVRYGAHDSTLLTSQIYVRGTGLNNSANRQCTINGVDQISGGNNTNRGLHLLIFDADNSLTLDSGTTYDTHAGGATVVANLATAIGNMDRTKIGVLCSYDAFTDDIDNTLRTAVQKVGLFKLAGMFSGTATRHAYAAIFRGTSDDADAEVNDAIEVIQSDDADAPTATISTFITVKGDGENASITGAYSVSALVAPAGAFETPLLQGKSSTNAASTLTIGSGVHLLPSGSAANDSDSNGVDLGGSSNYLRQIYVRKLNADNITATLTGASSQLAMTDQSSDATCFPVFVQASGTGNLTPHSNTSLTFNASTAELGASILKSTITTGTAPLTVTSTTTVTNLSADLLDGRDTSASGGNDKVMITNSSGNTSLGSGTFTTGVLKATGDANPVAEFDRGSANNTNLNLKYNGTHYGQISVADKEFQVSAVGSATTFKVFTNGSPRFEIDVNGNIGVNATPKTSGTLYNTVDHFLVIGDNDTGIAQDGDGQFEIWANNQEIANFNASNITLKKSTTIQGNLTVDGTLTYEDVTNVSTTGIITASAFIATGGTVDSGTENDPTNVAMMIEKDDYIYTNDGTNSKRKLIGKTGSEVIEIGQIGTALIDQISMRPGNAGDFRVLVGGATGHPTSHTAVRVSAGGTLSVRDTDPKDVHFEVKSDKGMLIRTDTNTGADSGLSGSLKGAKLLFSDQTSVSQIGHIVYKHSDGSISPGTNDGFIIGGSETLTVVKVEGRVLVDEKVGIGTNDPGNDILRIHHTGTSTPVTALTIGGKSITTGGGSGIFLKASSDTGNDNRYGTRIHTIRESTNNGASSLVISNEKSDASGLEERLRITSTGAVAFNGSTNYGSSGQILKSNGDAPPTWINADTASGVAVSIKQFKVGTTERTCPPPISVASGNVIGIGSTSNAYGNRYIGTSTPTGGNYCDGDIWYDTTGTESPSVATGDIIEATKFFQNPTSLTVTTTFPASGAKNGGAFGPYEIANGVTFTINSGSTFTIL